MPLRTGALLVPRPEVGPLTHTAGGAVAGTRAIQPLGIGSSAQYELSDRGPSELPTQMWLFTRAQARNKAVFNVQSYRYRSHT